MVLALKQIGNMSKLCLHLVPNDFWLQRQRHINHTKVSITFSWEIKVAHLEGKKVSTVGLGVLVTSQQCFVPVLQCCSSYELRSV